MNKISEAEPQYTVYGYTEKGHWLISEPQVVTSQEAYCFGARLQLSSL